MILFSCLFKQQKESEAIALSVVSYSGCGISMVALLGAIILLVFYR